MWDQRYQSLDYAYGTKPNQFLVDNISAFKPNGHILCPADGEGRNGVFLAQNGFQVTTFDQSSEGCKKAEKLARKHGVDIAIHHHSFQSFDYQAYDGVFLCFFHLLPDQRQLLHQQCVDALVSNGTLMLIGFSKEQLPLHSGGPKNIEMLFSKNDIRSDFHLLTQHSLNQYSANLDEGDFHQGVAEMVGFIGQKQ